MARIPLMDVLLWLLRPFFKAVLGLLAVLALILRPALRFLAAISMLAATIALTADVTRWQSGEAQTGTFQSLSAHIGQLAPATLKDIGAGVSRALHPWAWDPVLVSLLNLPAWMIFFAAALGLIYAGRERRQVNIFIN